MPTYRVTYAHENAFETDEKKKHGFATQELETDHEVTNQREYVEIARQIGKEHGYTKVGVMKVELKVEDEEEV